MKDEPKEIERRRWDMSRIVRFLIDRDLLLSASGYSAIWAASVIGARKSIYRNGSEVFDPPAMVLQPPRDYCVRRTHGRHAALALVLLDVIAPGPSSCCSQLFEGSAQSYASFNASSLAQK